MLHARRRRDAKKDGTDADLLENFYTGTTWYRCMLQNDNQVIILLLVWKKSCVEKDNPAIV